MRTVLILALSLVFLSCNRVTPTVDMTSTAQSVDEAQGTAVVSMQLSEAASLAVRVPYTLSGTATGGGTSVDDYLGENGTLTIPIGSTSASLSFPLVAHGAPIPDRTLIVTMGTPENAKLGSNQTHTVTIQQNTGGGGGGGGTTGGTTGGGTTGGTTGGGPPQDVNASFPSNTAPNLCPQAYVDIPFQLDFGQTAPSDLIFPLTVMATGGLVAGTDYSVTIPMAPGMALPTDASVTDLTIPNGGSAILVELAIDCNAVAGETITLSVTAPSGATLTTDQISVSF